jgi:hypothetical protein
MIEHMPKKDLVITAVNGYGWEHLRPFVLSLAASGFKGDKVILAANLDKFSSDCFTNRGYQVIPFFAPADTSAFVIRDRFVPFLNFLETCKKKYRYVLWVDSGDLIFQSDPSKWLTKHTRPFSIVGARENWLIKNETTWNDPWVKAALPNDYDWLREYEVLCGGTVAGNPATMHTFIKDIYDRVCKNPTAGGDQAILNYLLHKPFSVYFPNLPPLELGWTATLSSVIADGFTSLCGTKENIVDAPPVFDMKRGLVLTPDGKTPFVMVHQYNRDANWIRIVRAKYGLY